MDVYHKIQSIYKRDSENNFKTFLEGQYSRPEFEWLKNNKWVATEKVDGTNVRIIWDGHLVEARGKTDNAQMPGPLLKAVDELFLPEKFSSVFDGPVTLYGEGYGGKIQKAGATYGPEQRFVLFDIWIDGLWLPRSAVEGIADNLGLPLVPVVFEGTLDQMVEQTKLGWVSQWGDFQAEGIVVRPEVELLDRRGHRIITKIKGKDFPV